MINPNHYISSNDIYYSDLAGISEYVILPVAQGNGLPVTGKNTNQECKVIIHNRNMLNHSSSQQHS